MSWQDSYYAPIQRKLDKPMSMVEFAIDRIERSALLIIEIEDLFQNNPPFSYVVQTDTLTGQRSTYAKKNEPSIRKASPICGDIVHNLRSSIDHTYWEIVSPLAKNSKEKKRIQFPFCAKKIDLESEIKKRLGDRLSDHFFQTLLSISPHNEDDGNHDLFLLHELGTVDRHRFPIPTGNYTTLSSEVIRAQVPDFPQGLTNVGFGMSHRDVTWKTKLLPVDLGSPIPPTTYLFEMKLDVPVGIVIREPSSGRLIPLIPTLKRLTQMTRKTVRLLYDAARS